MFLLFLTINPNIKIINIWFYRRKVLKYNRNKINRLSKKYKINILINKKNYNIIRFGLIIIDDY